MRRLSAGGVPLLLMCYVLSAALCSSTPSTTTTTTSSSLPNSSSKQSSSSLTLDTSATQGKPSATMAGELGERAKELEGSLLHMFGLKRRPRPGQQPIVVPEFLVELYRQQTGLEVDTTNLNLAGKHTQTANTVRTFTHKESKADDKYEHENAVHLRFDLDSLPTEEQLKAGELRLYRSPEGFRTWEAEQGRRTRCARRTKHDGSDSMDECSGSESTDSTGSEEESRTDADEKRNKWRRKQQVLVHEIVKPGGLYRSKKTAQVVRREPILRLLDSRVVDVRDEGWLTFDVLPALLRWREQPERNHGLYVEMKRLESEELSDIEHFHVRRRRRRRRREAVAAAAEAEQEEREERNDLRWPSQQPLLVTYSDDGKARVRSKRAAEKKHKRKGRRDNCRRHSLYVDFNDVGWNDWIVAPPGYHAYYCHGDCPFPLPDHLNTTNHAIVQTLVHSVNPSAVPRACCVPTELSSISMLYIDEYDKVVLKNYHDMIVDACGCR